MYRPRKPGFKSGDIFTALEPAFEITPAQRGCSVVFASPHSGRIYPQDWLETCAVSHKALRAVEDIYVGDLFEAASGFGAGFIKALFPRSLVDVNRAIDDLPAAYAAPGAPLSVRAGAGLGVIPTALSVQTDIYKDLPSAAQIQERLQRLYIPYHSALRDMLATARTDCGRALLIDCHSMPGFGPLNVRRSDFILGDRYGKSCAPDMIDAVSGFLTARGYSVTRNHPYAGGHTTALYGQPDAGVSALQIEINRDLYVNPISLKPKRGYAKLKQDMTALAQNICERSASPAIAAQ